MKTDKEKLDPKNKRMHQRIDLDHPLNVRIASIGGNIQYDLVTKDLSHYGFFLAFDEPARFPFQASSILEIRLELPSQEVVFFNGKIARIVYPNTKSDLADTVPGVAIRIVQMDSTNEKKFEQFIQGIAPDFEKKSRSIA